jgi:phage-related protein (TIGR01555 family)
MEKLMKNYKSTLPTGFIKDGYRDLMKRMKTQNDNGHNHKELLSALPQLLASIFDGSSLGKDVITIPINDAFKEGRKIKSLDDKQEKIFNKAYIEYDNKIKQGLIFAGIFGGAYLVINTKSQSLEDELEIRKNDIENIAVLDPTQLMPFEISGNPLSKNYMKPTYYMSLYSETIHPSRVIFIDGDVCTNATRELNQGLGLSRYERIYSELKKLDTASEMILDITSTLSQDVISIDGLNEVLADKTGKGTELVHERLNIINSIKSIMSTLAIDGKDSYTNINRSLTGTDRVLQFLQMMVSSASRIPITKLFTKLAIIFLLH